MANLLVSNPWLATAGFVVVVVGMTFFWFGGLMAALTALGNKRWLWGACSLVLGPIVGLPYAVIHKEADYPRSLMLRGLSIILIAAIFMLVAALLV